MCSCNVYSSMFQLGMKRPLSYILTLLRKLIIKICYLPVFNWWNEWIKVNMLPVFISLSRSLVRLHGSSLVWLWTDAWIIDRSMHTHTHKYLTTFLPFSFLIDSNYDIFCRLVAAAARLPMDMCSATYIAYFFHSRQKCNLIWKQ